MTRKSHELDTLIANRVEAMAVCCAKGWPSAQTVPRDIGARIVNVRRPAHYFDPNKSQWFEAVGLAQEQIAQCVKEREQQAAMAGMSHIDAVASAEVERRRWAKLLLAVGVGVSSDYFSSFVSGW